MAVILHAADLHLGGPVAAPAADLVRVAAQARQKALDRLVELCRGRHADVLLLAGDVFHRADPPLHAVAALERALGDVTAMGARVFIAPGNHDPWCPGSVWDNLRPPQGVTVFPPGGGGAALPELGLFVAGAAHDSSRVSLDLSAAMPAPPPGLRAVGLLHCDLAGEGAVGRDLYAPTSLPRLSSLPYDFWALGHIHQPGVVAREPLVLYAGAMQGAHFGESGLMGCWLLDSDQWQPEFLPLAGVTFLRLEVDAPAQIHGTAQLGDLLRESLPPQVLDDLSGVCLRARLRGASPLWNILRGQDLEALGGALAHGMGLAWLELDPDGLTPPLDMAELTSRQDLLGDVLRLANAVEADPAMLADMGRALAPSLHPSTRDMGPEARVASLLDQARGLAVQGLLSREEGEGRDVD